MVQLDEAKRNVALSQQSTIEAQKRLNKYGTELQKAAARVDNARGQLDTLDKPQLKPTVLAALSLKGPDWVKTAPRIVARSFEGAGLGLIGLSSLSSISDSGGYTYTLGAVGLILATLPLACKAITNLESRIQPHFDSAVTRFTAVPELSDARPALEYEEGKLIKSAIEGKLDYAESLGAVIANLAFGNILNLVHSGDSVVSAGVMLGSTLGFSAVSVLTSMAVRSRVEGRLKKMSNYENPHSDMTSLLLQVELKKAIDDTSKSQEERDAAKRELSSLKKGGRDFSSEIQMGRTTHSPQPHANPESIPEDEFELLIKEIATEERFPNVQRAQTAKKHGFNLGSPDRDARMNSRIFLMANLNEFARLRIIPVATGIAAGICGLALGAAFAPHCDPKKPASSPDSCTDFRKDFVSTRVFPGAVNFALAAKNLAHFAQVEFDLPAAFERISSALAPYWRAARSEDRTAAEANYCATICNETIASLRVEAGTIEVKSAQAVESDAIASLRALTSDSPLPPTLSLPGPSSSAELPGIMERIALLEQKRDAFVRTAKAAVKQTKSHLKHTVIEMEDLGLIDVSDQAVEDPAEAQSSTQPSHEPAENSNETETPARFNSARSLDETGSAHFGGV